jgi:hypothetical protein
MCSDKMVVKPMIACVPCLRPIVTISHRSITHPPHPTALFPPYSPLHPLRYKGIHVLVKVAGETGPDQSALRMQASRSLARLALDPDAHQSIMMSGALQHIMALAKQDHMDPLRLDGKSQPAVLESSLFSCVTPAQALWRSADSALQRHAGKS